MDDGFLEDEQDHQHDDRVTSCGFHVKGEINQQKLNEWLGWLLKEKLAMHLGLATLSGLYYSCSWVHDIMGD